MRLSFHFSFNQHWHQTPLCQLDIQLWSDLILSGNELSYSPQLVKKSEGGDRRYTKPSLWRAALGDQPKAFRVFDHIPRTVSSVCLGPTAPRLSLTQSHSSSPVLQTNPLWGSGVEVDFLPLRVVPNPHVSFPSALSSTGVSDGACEPWLLV